MNVISARSPKHTAQGGIELMVRFEKFSNEDLPFHAHPSDPEPHGRELYARAMAGDFGPVEPYVQPAPPVVLLTDLAAAKLAKIHAGKISARDGGIILDAVRFDSDAQAIAMYHATLTTMSMVPDFTTDNWRASVDPATGLGIVVTMDLPKLQALWLAGVQHIDRCNAWQNARETEVAAALATGDREALLAPVPVFTWLDEA